MESPDLHWTPVEFSHREVDDNERTIEMELPPDWPTDEEELPTIPLGTFEREPKSTVQVKPSVLGRKADESLTLVTSHSEMRSLRERSRPSAPPGTPAFRPWPVVPTERGNEEVTSPVATERLPAPRPATLPSLGTARVPVRATPTAPALPLPGPQLQVSPLAETSRRPQAARLGWAVVQGVAVAAILLGFNALGAWLARPHNEVGPTRVITVGRAAEPAKAAPGARKWKVESLAPRQFVAEPVATSDGSDATVEAQLDPATSARRGRRALAAGREALGEGDYDRAVLALQRAARYRRADADTHALLGDALLHTLDTQAALRAYQKALKLQPDHEAAAAGARRAGLLQRTRRSRSSYQAW